MKFAFIAKHRHLAGQLAVRPAGGLALGLSCMAEPPSRSDRAILDAKLVAAIDTGLKASARTCGARRVWHDVLEVGLICGLHRIERLMRRNALKARPERRGKPGDDGERSVIADSEPVNATGPGEPANPRPGFSSGSAEPEGAGRLYHRHRLSEVPIAAPSGQARCATALR